MSGATHPIQICDAEDGCSEWAIDIPATGGRIVSGRDPLDGWAIDRRSDRSYCPEHATEADRLALDGFPATEASDLLDAVVQAEGQEYHTLDCPFGCTHPVSAR